MSTGDAIARWGIIGHDAAVSHLASSIASGRFPHAYLIVGPDGVGRRSLALALARALNCQAAPASRPCNECDDCRRLSRGTHPDLTLVDFEWQEQMFPRKRGESPRRRLSIEAVRWLRSDIASRPMQGRWKVQIITDAEYLTDEATDAYLKTLEEPPAFAVIVLIAESVDAVPETIASRCQVVALGSVATGVIYDTLRSAGLDEGDAAQLARAARGRIGWALDLATDPERRANRRREIEIALEQITDPLTRATISGALTRDFSKRRDAIFASLDHWTGLWRDALLYRHGLGDRACYPEVEGPLASYANRWQIDELYRALWATRRCANDLESNVNPRAALHAMVMQWPE